MRILQSSAVLLPLLFLSACTGGLTPTLRRHIADEHERVRDAGRQIERYAEALQHDEARDPDLFRNAQAPAKWSAQMQAARNTLRTAEEADRELASLSGRDRSEYRERAEKLLASEKNLRRSAVEQARSTANAADRWIHFKDDLAGNLDRMKQNYEAVKATDLTAVTAVVQKAYQDWPAKKETLDSCLNVVLDIPKAADTQWTSSEPLRKSAADQTISSSALATLIETDDTLSAQRDSITGQAAELRNMSNQLYNSWDKILVDLDRPAERIDSPYRERIKTVRTHLTDVASKQTETSSSEQWVPVSEASFHAVENDLGMAIAHKDAGLFDSEASNMPEPAGFAYIAPETQGSNQYGYWNHDGGTSVWTWLPQYLILRELLWNHAYRPVILDDYRGYRTAERLGRTYYGQTTPASTPKYGTHGTFTQTSYAKSRYVQSGGFKGSAYASRGNSGSPSAFGSARPGEPRSSPSFSDRGSGKRFGSGVSPSSGRRFGRSGASRGFGRSFGRRR